AQPSLIALCDLEIAASLPWNLSGAGGLGWGAGSAGSGPFGADAPSIPSQWRTVIGGPPVRWSVRDVPVPGRGLYVHMLDGNPVIERDRTLGAGATVTQRALNSNHFFDPLVGGRIAYQGKVVRYHLFDVDTQTFTPNLFVGQLVHVAWGDSPFVVTLVFAQNDPLA